MKNFLLGIITASIILGGAWYVSAKKTWALIEEILSAPAALSIRNAVRNAGIEEGPFGIGWKIFKDKDVTFKYPADWEVDKKESFVGGLAHYTARIISPSRSNFPGYEGQSIVYTLMIEKGRLPVGGFSTVERQVGQDGVFNVDLANESEMRESLLAQEIKKTVEQK